MNRIKRVLIINLLLLLAAAILLSLEKAGLLYTACISKEVFNLYCSGCGMTRLCRAVLRGDFYQAFRYNQLMFILIPVFAVTYVCETIRYLKTGKLGKKLNYFLIIIGILMILYGILRNFSYFSILTPVQL